MNELLKKNHNRFAPYWAGAMVIFTLTALSTNWLDWGPFWKGYVLDIFGPAWNYILFRNLFTAYRNTRWTRFFTPWRTLIICVLVLFAIEGAQYLEWYDSTFDPWDFVAYVSLIVPLFVIDLRIRQISNSKAFR